MVNKKIASVWIVSIIIAANANVIDFADEGSDCVLHDGNHGVCKLSTQCKWLTDRLANRTMKYSDIVRCGFRGTTTIACCGDESGDPSMNALNGTNVLVFTSNPNSTTEERSNVISGKRIADACQRYSKLAIPFSKDSILNGWAASLTEYPHMAALGYNNGFELEFKCGGSVIADQWIVTAAHCVPPKRPPSMIRMAVTFLEDDIKSPVDLNIDRIIRHPMYNAQSKRNDIALIRLEQSIPFDDYVRPACIRTELEDVSADTELIIAGWGLIDNKKNIKSNELQQANVTVVPISSCNVTLAEYNKAANQPQLRSFLDRTQMCAQDVTSTDDKIIDTCEGDSGSPIFTYQRSGLSTLVGITSFGVFCGTRLPSVYTRLASYTDWIENTIWPN